MNPRKPHWFISLLKNNTLLVGGMATLLLLWVIGPRLAINTSPSIPIGFYILQNYEGEPLQTGDFVLFYDQEVNSFAARRGYTRNGEAMGKRVGAIEGEQIDVGREKISIAGKMRLKKAPPKDSKGRPMNIFHYAGTVPEGSVFLVGDTDDSFDSRYYGFVKKKLSQQQ